MEDSQYSSAVVYQVKAVACVAMLLLCSFGNTTKAQTTSSLVAGLTLDASELGEGLGVQLGCRLNETLTVNGHFSAAAFGFTQQACAAFAPDTFAFVRGSFLYLGDEHREANFFVRQQSELTLGPTASMGGRLRFTMTLRGGVRWLEVDADVDEVVSDAAESKRRFFGCGEFYVGRTRPSSPQELEQPTRFSSTALGGVVVLGVGLEYEVYAGWRVFGQLQSRQYFYGNAQFRVRDPRQAGLGSQVLNLRDHAPDSEYRVQFGILAPLSL